MTPLSTNWNFKTFYTTSFIDCSQTWFKKQQQKIFYLKSFLLKTSLNLMITVKNTMKILQLNIAIFTKVKNCLSLFLSTTNNKMQKGSLISSLSQIIITKRNKVINNNKIWIQLDKKDTIVFRKLSKSKNWEIYLIIIKQWKRTLSN